MEDVRKLMHTWSAASSGLSGKQKGVLFGALIHYYATGQEPEGLKDGIVKVIYSVIVSGSIHTDLQTCESGMGGAVSSDIVDSRSVTGVEIKKKRGGQPGNRNAKKRIENECETNKNECETNKNECETNKNECETNDLFVFAPHVNNINNNINNIHDSQKEKKYKQKKEKVFSSENTNADSVLEHDYGFRRDFNCLIAKWKSLADTSSIQAVMPKWNDIIPSTVVWNFNSRCEEYGLAGVLEAVDLLRESPFWKNKKIGIGKFLQEDFFQKLHDGGYDWNPDEPKGKPKPDKRKGTAGVHPDDVEKYKSFDLTMKFDP